MTLQLYVLHEGGIIISEGALPGSSHILVTSFLDFCRLGCVIFCTMFSVCKARWARQNEKETNFYVIFGDFVAKNNQKRSYQNGMKRLVTSKIVHKFSLDIDEIFNIKKFEAYV